MQGRGSVLTLLRPPDCPAPWRVCREPDMISRRGLLLAAASSGVAHAAGAQPTMPGDNRLAFRVVRNGSAIGTHVLTFARSGNGIDIHIAVDLAIGLGPFILFRYTLRGLEQWRDGAIVHVDGAVNDDGTPETMRADRDARGLWVEGSQAPRYLAPADALPATHWNMAELQAPWINMQGGRLLHPAVTRVGAESMTLPNGRTETATHYALSGDAKLDLWYDAEDQWSALGFVAKDGSVIRYELS